MSVGYDIRNIPAHPAESGAQSIRRGACTCAGRIMQLWNPQERSAAVSRHLWRTYVLPRFTLSQLLIGNGRLVTRDPAQSYFDNGCVAIDGNRVAEVGKTDEVRAKYPGAEWVDAQGGVIMPGMICTHNHIYSAFARGLAIRGYSPQNLMDILKGMWWTIDTCLNREETKWSAYAVYLECIRNGTTTVFDHHASFGEIEGTLFEIADVAKELGIRSCLCFEVTDRNGKDAMEKAVKENEDFILAAQKDTTGMLAGMMGMHAPFTLSDATIEYCKEHTPEGAGYHIHVAEGIEDVQDSLKKYGKRTVERLYELGILGPLTIAGHCVYVSNREIGILKDTNTMVVHNPESNMGNAVGIGPVIQMVQQGILMGLGTDGYTNDMFESYKVANIIHKHNLQDPGAAWAEIPQMLFYGNAEIGGRYFKDAPLGVLKEGAAADVIVTDYIPDTPMDSANANSHILFGMCGKSVTTTVVDGRVLMKDRRILVADEDEILARCRESAAKLWQNVNSK